MTAFSPALPIDLLTGFPALGADHPAGLPAAGTAAETGAGAAALCPFELQWIREAQAGGHEAFRLLVERHQALIRRLSAQWLQSGEDAEEVCQDTFLKAWQALPVWEPRARFSAWLCRIALNLCRDRAKSRARRQGQLTIPLATLTESPVCAGITPDQAAARAGDLEKLQRGLAALPPATREVLILCAIENLSHREAAEVLNCSPRAIEGRLYRARQVLLEWWNTES